VTLAVVVDPVGLVPTFLAVTHGLPQQARRRIAVRASIIAAALLAGTALLGDWLLHQLGITLPAFRIAGGLLLFSIASEMVLGVRIERQSRDAEQACEEHVRDIAAFPLATPLLAGPGWLPAAPVTYPNQSRQSRRSARVLPPRTAHGSSSRPAGSRPPPRSAAPLFEHLEVPEHILAMLPFLPEDHENAVQHDVVFMRVTRLSQAQKVEVRSKCQENH